MAMGVVEKRDTVPADVDGTPRFPIYFADCPMFVFCLLSFVYYLELVLSAGTDTYQRISYVDKVL